MWNEATVGTNGIGLALAADRPASVFSAEHWLDPVHDWVCYSAPFHDPSTGRVLGVVDVTGGPDVASPQTLAMIRAAARMAESELARLALTGTATQFRYTPRPCPRSAQSAARSRRSA